MKKKNKRFLLVLLAMLPLLFAWASCSSDSDSAPQTSSGTGSESGTSTAVSTLASALTAAINDEYKARNTYNVVISAYGQVRPFVNIVRSEEQHIRLVANLFTNHGLAVPADSTGTPAVPASIGAACQVGVQAEISNGALYDQLLAATTTYADVQSVFKQLQAASLTGHLPAFQRCAR